MVVMSMMNFYKSGAAVPMCGAHTSLPDKQAKVIDQKNLWGRLFVMSVYSIYMAGFILDRFIVALVDSVC